MKNKLLKILLLVFLLSIFPKNLNVYAEEVDKEIVNQEEMTSSVDEKESFQGTYEYKNPILMESEVILSENKDSEEVIASEEEISENENSEEVIASGENSEDKKVLENTNLSEEEIASKKEISEENQDLEISDDKEIEAVGYPDGYRPGGGSSGGGGSFSSQVGKGPKIEFYIEKRDKETGNPMEVAFKITDLETGKSHIVITKPDGKSNLIELFSSIDFKIALNPYLGPSPEGEIRSKDIEKFKKDVEDNKDKYVNLEDMPFPIEKKEHDIDPPIHWGGVEEAYQCRHHIQKKISNSQ